MEISSEVERVRCTCDETGLIFHLLFQYIPRFFRILPLSSELKRTSGVFAETAWAGAAYYFLLYMLASHPSFIVGCVSAAISHFIRVKIVGAFWYLLAMERSDACWRKACSEQVSCNMSFLYCGIPQTEAYNAWHGIGGSILNSSCSSNRGFDYGIYTNPFSSGIVSSKKFHSKYCYCLWWGGSAESKTYLQSLLRVVGLGDGLSEEDHQGVVQALWCSVSGMAVHYSLVIL